MIDWNTAQQLIQDQIKTFPAEFGLRAFPGERFRISPRSSYVNDAGVVQLYTERYSTGYKQWLDFCKGTAQELQREIVNIKQEVRK